MSSANQRQGGGMKLYSNNIQNGVIAPEFGKYGEQKLPNGKPTRSFHLSWSDVPAKTKSLAIIFSDQDAIPPCGFEWIHWTVANIEPTMHELPENASCELDLLQGATSWSSGLLSDEMRLGIDEDSGFGGCAPPDKDHTYTIEFFALDCVLDLSPGFFKNELWWAMQGHIIDTAKLEAIYRC